MAQPPGASCPNSISRVDLGPQRRRHLGATQGGGRQNSRALSKNHSRDRGSAARLVRFDGFAGRFECKRQSFFGNAGDKGRDDPT